MSRPKPPMNLNQACEHGDANLVKELISTGADVNNGDSGLSPLCVACKHGHLEVVRILVEHGAEINELFSDDFPPKRACMAGSLKIVTYLLAQGANVNQTGTYSYRAAIQEAAERGHLEIVKELYLNGADLNNEDEHNATALARACEKGHTHVVEYLLQQGAFVTIPHIVSRFVIQGGYIDIFKLLLKYSAIMAGYLKDDEYIQRYTPLCHAAELGRLDIVELLMRHGANVHRADMFGHNVLYCLMLTTSNEAYTIAKSLLKMSVCTTGVLYRAVGLNNVDMVWLLMKHGEELDAVQSRQAMELTADNPALRNALGYVWSPKDHHRFPKRIRAVIKTILLVARRLQWSFGQNVVHSIISYVAFDKAARVHGKSKQPS